MTDAELDAASRSSREVLAGSPHESEARLPRGRRALPRASWRRCSTPWPHGRRDPASVPPVLAGRGVALRVPEAVGPHPQQRRDGGGRPRRSPGHDPARRDQHRRARDRGGRRPHAGRVPRDHRGAGVRPRRARAHGRRRRRPDRQPALGPRASVPGAGRPAHDPRAVRPARGSARRVRRRRQQRHRVARVRRRAHRDGAARHVATGLRARRRRRRPGPQPRRLRSSSSPIRTKR